MLNFNFHNPVEILFGEGKVKELTKRIPDGSKVMITYGGGSIKKNGVYEQVCQALASFEMLEFGGIEANPHYETAMRAVEIIREEKVDFLLAVGGGSVVDATKFMAAAAKYKGEDAWEIITKGLEVPVAIPLGVVLTLPATGTEMNKNAVVTKAATQEKLAFYSPNIMPKFSILDPAFTYSLPPRQVANGVVDAFVHVIEQYLTYPVDSPVQDRFSEGLLVTLIEEGTKAMDLDTPDYNNRANIVWAATMALNGIIASGVKECWATHKIGHELTAFHGLDHALTLAIVLPGLMEEVRTLREEKLSQYAERVWGISEGSKQEKISLAIEKTEAFFQSVGMKIHLSDHGIGDETIERIVDRFRARGEERLQALEDIDLNGLRAILERRK